jgi:hypothetical protein
VVERGWMTREAALERTLVTLRFFSNSSQSAEPGPTGYKGFYYHFLHMQSGERTWRSELSLIDTALLLAGILTAGAYFADSSSADDSKNPEFITRNWRHTLDTATISKDQPEESGKFDSLIALIQILLSRLLRTTAAH